jgi:hypothetical protein
MFIHGFGRNMAVVLPCFTMCCLIADSQIKKGPQFHQSWHIVHTYQEDMMLLHMLGLNRQIQADAPETQP